LYIYHIGRIIISKYHYYVYGGGGPLLLLAGLGKELIAGSGVGEATYWDLYEGL
jgi:hypothetical protein